MVQDGIAVAVKVRTTEPARISAGLGLYVGVNVVGLTKVPGVPLEVQRRFW